MNYQSAEKIRLYLEPKGFDRRERKIFLQFYTNELQESFLKKIKELKDLVLNDFDNPIHLTGEESLFVWERCLDFLDYQRLSKKKGGE